MSPRLCECGCGQVPPIAAKTRRDIGWTKGEPIRFVPGHQGRLNRTHGATSGREQTRAYRVWRGILTRCLNPRCASYGSYGGRGITVCPEWRESFGAFLADMGDPPDGYSIERRENDGPYSKENCLWASDRQQRRNKRNSLTLTFHGKTQILADWAVELRIPYLTLYQRLRAGWSDERTLSEGIHVQGPAQ